MPTRKSKTERLSRYRAMMGHRYLPEAARPSPDGNIKLFPGCYIAVLDLHEDELHRYLISQGLLTQAQLEADESNERVDAAVLTILVQMISTKPISGKALRITAPARANLGNENKYTDVRPKAPARAGSPKR